MAAIEKWKPTGKMSLLTLAGFQNNCLRVRDPIVKWDFSITTTPRVSRFSNAFYKDSIIFIAPSGHSAHNGLERSLGSLVVLFNRKSLQPGVFKREKRQLKTWGIWVFIMTGQADIDNSRPSFRSMLNTEIYLERLLNYFQQIYSDHLQVTISELNLFETKMFEPRLTFWTMDKLSLKENC